MTKTRGSTLRLTRFRIASSDDLHVGMPHEDSFYAIFQLKDHPPHDHWIDGQPRPAAYSPRGCLHIADLNAKPTAFLRGPVDSLNMELPRAALDDIADEVGAPRITSLQVPAPWQTPDRQLTELQALILAALAEPEATSPLFSGHLLLATAVHIGETYGGLRRDVVRTGGLAPWQERRARELIASESGPQVALCDVASECELSISHFCKAFKVSTGLTPHGWLQRCRLERARALLRHPGRSLAEVALLCGFADQSHFSRTFRRFSGLTPGAWRRQQRL